jgi:hypothetical protein
MLERGSEEQLRSDRNHTKSAHGTSARSIYIKEHECEGCTGRHSLTETFFAKIPRMSHNENLKLWQRNLQTCETRESPRSQSAIMSTSGTGSVTPGAIMANTADDVLFKPVDIGTIGRCVGKLVLHTPQLHAQ